METLKQAITDLTTQLQAAQGKQKASDAEIAKLERDMAEFKNNKDGKIDELKVSGFDRVPCVKNSISVCQSMSWWVVVASGIWPPLHDCLWVRQVTPDDGGVHLSRSTGNSRMRGLGGTHATQVPVLITCTAYCYFYVLSKNICIHHALDKTADAPDVVARSHAYTGTMWAHI